MFQQDLQVMLVYLKFENHWSRCLFRSRLNIFFWQEHFSYWCKLQITSQQGAHVRESHNDAQFDHLTKLVTTLSPLRRYIFPLQISKKCMIDVIFKYNVYYGKFHIAEQCIILTLLREDLFYSRFGVFSHRFSLL